jgi:opacity protein-like surface antigen
MKSILVLALFLVAPSANAYVFSLDQASFAPYIKGIYGAGIENTTVTKSVGATTTLENKLSSLMGGEFGFSWVGKRVHLRLAVEMLNPPKVQAAKGYNPSNQELFSVDSSLNVVSPKLGLDFNLKSGKSGRFFAFAEGGSATLTATNSFTMTAQGVADLGLSSDFSEELKGTATMYQYGLGVEYHSFDTTTFIIEAGYRHMDFATINYNKDVTNIGGARVKGEKALNSDGSARSMNLTDYFAAVSFRIYIF